MKNYFFLGILVSLAFGISAQKYAKKGLAALSQANFGIAKKYFYKELKKDSVSAAFGLSNFYLEPFCYQADSAFTYLTFFERAYLQLDVKSKSKLKKDLAFNDTILADLFDQLATKELHTVTRDPEIKMLELFMEHYGQKYPAYKEIVVCLRDSLAFDQAVKTQSSAAMLAFMVMYPNAIQQKEAKASYDRLLYQERTQHDTEAELKDFLTMYPDHPFVEKAWERIYNKYLQDGTLDAFEGFIQKYPKAPQVASAWRQIYKLYMQPYSTEKLAQFKMDFPTYPFLQDLEADGSLLQKKLYPFTVNNLYGYMDAEGKIAIAAQYDEASAFVEGLAIVALKERYGLINKKNEPIVPFAYLDISPIKSGYIAEDSTGYFLFNFQGRKQQNSPQQWEELQQTLVALDGQDQIMITASEVIFEKVSQNGKYGLKKAGKLILPIKYDEIIFTGENDYLLARNGKALLYFDPTGKKIEINGLEWFAAAPELAVFSKNGVAVFCKGNKFGLLDKKGKVLIKNSYDAVQAPYEGLYPFQFAGKWGVLGADAQLKIPFDYMRITVLVPHGFLLENQNGLGLMNQNANWLLEPAYKTIKRFENDFFLVENENGLGLSKTDGSSLLPCAYQRIVKFDDYTFQLTTAKGLAYFLLAENKIVALQP